MLCFHCCPLPGFDCLSVRLSVCLLATLRKNGWTNFHEIFRVGGTTYKEQLGTFQDIPFNPLNTGIFVPLFQRNPWLLAALQKNGWTNYYEIFRKERTWHKEQFGTFSGILRLTLWTLGRLIYFMDPSLFIILWKTGERTFMNFYEMSGTTQEITS